MIPRRRAGGHLFSREAAGPLLFRVLLSLALLAALLFAGPLQSGERGPRRGVVTLPADARTLPLARSAGFDTVVQLFSWRQIEPTRGEFHWQYPDEVVAGAAYYGLKLVVRLDQHPAWAADAPLSVNAPPDDPAAYAAFAARVAARYRGRVLAYIVWNEPNLAADWGGRPPNPAAYVALLRAAYPALKAADPAALVVSAGLASTNDRTATALDDRQYLAAMYAAGARPYFDVLGAHPYGFAYPPDDPHGSHDGLNMARLADLRSLMVAAGDGAKPIWATEMGWTVAATGAAAWQTVSAEQQADYLAQAYRQAGKTWPWLGLVAVWNLGGERDSDWGGYSLLDADGRPRPAYLAVQQLAPRPASRAGASRPPGSRVQILAADAPVHLGHRAYPEPWVPLFNAISPSPAWQGTFYLAQPDPGPWRLTLRLMQSNAWGNHISINGRRLEPSFPAEDYSATWVSASWPLPAGILRPGPNQIEITVGEAAPLLQDTPFTWDDLQFKDITLSEGGP